MKISTHNLCSLVEKWDLHIVVKGSEFMLPAQLAKDFAEDLVKLGEIIIGCDGWYFIKNSNSKIVQDIQVELTIEEFVPWDKMTPERNFNIVAEFLQELPRHIDLISFQLNDVEMEERISVLVQRQMDTD